MNDYYENLFAKALHQTSSVEKAAQTVADALLDGKPTRNSKATAAERHAAFWTCSFIRKLPLSCWEQEPMVLCLARYLVLDGRAPVEELLAYVASKSPAALRRAARYSGLVLKQSSRPWREFEDLALTHPDSFADVVEIFQIFDKAHQLRLNEVRRSQAPLSQLTPAELLAYASLYAFEYLVPPALSLANDHADIDTQANWDAINDILVWKLQTCDPGQLQLDDNAIALSLREHLTPFLFPSQEAPRIDLYASFIRTVEDRVELNGFISQSADAFSYDDGIQFVRHGDRLEIEELDPTRGAVHARENEKLNRLHQYWLFRGMDALMASPELLARVGSSNLDANLQAFAKAVGTWLQLQEVYGVAESITTDTGLKVDGFRAILALELMTVFYIVDFLQPFTKALASSGDSKLALGQLAFGGLRNGDPQNRFPVTWSDRQTKISRIKAWTVTEQEPQGSSLAAEAILDFWTSDWNAMAESLKSGTPGQIPDLLERPILKIGSYLFQLPWMVAMQNNATAAINNLRRIGARRAEAREETQRIEGRLGKQLEQRGFCVVPNYQPAKLDDEDPGEIDLVCARDGQVLVLEVKSTFMRRSTREAWIHRTSTLRKAGLQIERKVRAVERALALDTEFSTALGFSDLSATAAVTGWIIDTSIEFDHIRFNGYLKVSLEELIVALRDDRQWLNDPEGLFNGKREARADNRQAQPDYSNWSLYKAGFSAPRLIEVIERELVWSPLDATAPNAEHDAAGR